MTTKGLIHRSSKYSVKETIDKLQAFLQEHGATIYARIDQQAELAKANQTSLPLQFLLFGNPKSGGPIMLYNVESALDLPLKLIAYEDKEKQVWVAYNEAGYIKERYNLPDEISGVLNLDPLIDKALV